ncbi:glycosyltransferase family protein [Actinomadura macrotermitis]|uniref:Ubiquinone biosynthesis O-methyltransferase n=1 Tax=Actinomadura macrotermitis TaxID=2585200 RepID=A0A7K0BUU6_9ACTN|nr:methyltransferase domain-containing protein [Actinomadura macrotermitis]MQY04444.1 Ubiquinone biosynthesis O-methyltransferase [Actinomadura macrotermitis]
MANSDRISELYKGEIWGARVQRIARARVDWLVGQAAGEVLDIGCSQGIASILCARRGLRTVGLDSERDRIEYALADRDREPQIVQDLLEFRVGDARQPDLPPDSFDTVLLGEVVEHLVDASPILDAARQVLRPGGRLVLTTPFGYHPHHDHRATFYVASLLDLVAPYFTPRSLDVVDGYFRCVATPGAMDPAAKQELLAGLQPVLEQEFLAVERDLREARTRAEALTTELAAAREQAGGFARLEERLGAIADQQHTALADLGRRLEEARAEADRLKDEVRAAKEELRREKSAAEERIRLAKSRVAELERAAAGLQNVQGKLDYQEYRTRYLDWQLKSTQTRRWWRVGESLFGVKEDPRNLLALPGEIIRASVKMPMPAPPQKPARRRAPAPAAKALPAATGAAPKPAAPATRPMPEIPEVALPDGPVSRPGLTVATILDTFSEMAFKYEWRQVAPTPDDWREVMERERPALLFVESVWQGNQGAWFKHVHGPTAPSDTLRELVAWCREQGVPTVFWNKEDPPNFDLFIESARIFDWIFTVDADSVPRYRELVGHDRIGVLPFGAQPRVHNPVSVPGGRRNDVVFAGTYFTQKHPERRVQMETVLRPATEFELDIFSRVDPGNPRYAFPEPYAAHVVGSLPYERMLAAYKAYKVFLNVNSVVGSPTMCARRIFELSACSTPVLSAPSPAIEEIFPGLVSVAHTPDEARAHLRALLGSAPLRDRQAHLAMREVFAKHTYAHRVDHVLETIGLPFPVRERSVSVTASSNRPGQLTHLIEQVAAQSVRPLQLVLVLHGLDLDPGVVREKALMAGLEDVVVLAADAGLNLGQCLNLAVDAADGDVVAKFDDDDIYGEHYLSDLLTAFTYTDASIVGKAAYYAHLQASDAVVLRRPVQEHSYVDLVGGATMVVERDLLRRLRYDETAVGEDTGMQRRAVAEGARIYSADRFSYVQVRRADKASHTWRIEDEEFVRSGRVEFYGSPERSVIF